MKARIYAEQIEVWYAQRKIEVLPRLRGESGHWINYRHVIDRLVRKPGAFENYRYKDDLFPTSQFRIAYDLLREQAGAKQGNQQYLKLLELAAHENETLVNETLRFLLGQAGPLDVGVVEERVKARLRPPAVTEIEIAPVDLRIYDQLLEYEEVLVS